MRHRRRHASCTPRTSLRVEDLGAAALRQLLLARARLAERFVETTPAQLLQATAELSEVLRARNMTLRDVARAVTQRADQLTDVAVSRVHAEIIRDAVELDRGWTAEVVERPAADGFWVL